MRTRRVRARRLEPSIASALALLSALFLTNSPARAEPRSAEPESLSAAEYPAHEGGTHAPLSRRPSAADLSAADRSAADPSAADLSAADPSAADRSAADPDPDGDRVTGADADGDEVAGAADLDGTYLALGPRGAALYRSEAWDAAFGAELSLYRYRERAPISILGAAGGFLTESARDRRHLFAEAGAGADLPLGVRAGASAGVTGETSPVQHTRWGAHATLWLFAGPIAYARAGQVQETGFFADFGIRVALPALRF